MKRMLAEGKLTDVQRDSFTTPRATEFLFDVVADPDCVRNLVDDRSLQSQLEELRAALATWQADTDNVFPGEASLTPDGFDRDSGARMINAAHPSLVKPSK